MKTLFVLLLLLPLVVFAETKSNVVEIEINGMTCAFCADGLDAKLNRLSGVRQAQVSLKKSRARIELEPGHTPDLAAIRQAIIDAGFTPGDLHVGS